MRRAALTLAAVLAACAARLPAALADAPSAERASDLYRRATKLYTSRDLAAAEPLYQEAWTLRHGYDIASNYGALELELGKPRRAAELLRFALDHFPTRGRADARAAIEARWGRARREVGALVVRVSADGAEVTVDGAPSGKAPLDTAILVDPGEHVVAARLAGYGDTQVTVRVARGAEEHPTLTLAPVRRRSPAPAVTGGVLAALSLGAGGALIAMAEAKRGDASTLHDMIQAGGGTCASPSGPCTSLHRATSAADTYGNTGIALLAIGGGLAAATATYLLWPSAGPTRDVRVTLRAGPSSGGAVISGAF